MISVLYVDDEPGLLELGQLFLEQTGEFKVTISTSAMEPLSSLRVLLYDAIVSDYQMPDMDGIAFLKAVRAQSTDIPFILFTGRGREEVVIEAINNGADFYLQKGGNPQTQFAELAHKIRQAVRRKRAERLLQESEEKFRTIFKNSPYPIAIHSIPDNKFLEVNKAFLDASGYTEAEILGKDPVELGLLPITEVLKLVSRRMLMGKLENVPLVLTVKERRRVHVLFSTLPVTINNKPALMTVTAEVTKLKRVEEDLLKKNEELKTANEQLAASEEELRQNYDELKKKEQALRESENIFRLLEGQLPDYVIIHEGETIVFVNAEGARLIGKTPEQIVGTSVLSYTPPEYHDLLKKNIGLRQKGAVVEPYDIEIIAPSGERRWVVVRATSLRDWKKPASLTVLTDITERRKAEEALRQANKKLGLLSSITRHDINNQLMALNAYIGLLHKNIPDSSFEDYRSRITKTGNRITAMIAFTREYEKIGIHAPVWQDIAAVVDTVGKEIIPGQVAIKNDLPASIGVFADPLIVKVFYNLLDNSIRHGQRVTEILVSSHLSGEDLVVVWEDNGIGIAANEKERIFERGFGKNTGLGMFLVREVLSLTGITIRETGEFGERARFEILVPKGVWRTTGNDSGARRG